VHPCVLVRMGGQVGVHILHASHAVRTHTHAHKEGKCGGGLRNGIGEGGVGWGGRERERQKHSWQY